MGQDNQWLKPVLAQGVAMLLLLRLKNSPTEDVIQPTLEAWYRVITYKKSWNMELDKVRFETALVIGFLRQHSFWKPCHGVNILSFRHHRRKVWRKSHRKRQKWKVIYND